MSDRPQQKSLFSREMLLPALIDSVRKLDPRHMVRNPVMFVVEIGALITTVIWIVQLFGGSAPGGDDPAWYTVTVAVWLWLTVVFGNFAEAIAEGRGKAQAATLRAMRSETVATMADGSQRRRQRADARRPRRRRGGRAHPRRRHRRRGHRLGRRVRDHRRVRARHPRGRRRPLGRHRRHAGAVRPHRRRDHAGARPELPRPHDRARRGRRPAQDPERDRARHPPRRPDADLPRRRRRAAARSPTSRTPATSTTTLISLLVALIPTTIGALLSAIGIAGMDRLVRRNVLALSGRAVEASGDVDVLLLDKTGTITLGNRQAADVRADARRVRGRARRGGADVVARRRDARGPLDRRPRQAVRDPRARARAAATRTSSRSPRRRG